MNKVKAHTPIDADEYCAVCDDDNVAVTIVSYVQSLTIRAPFCGKCFEKLYIEGIKISGLE